MNDIYNLVDMNNTNTLTWGDVSYAANLASQQLVPEWEIVQCIWQAWEIMSQSGLTKYSTRIELCEVVIRFINILTLYFEFCDNYQKNEKYYIFWVLEKLEAANINGFHIRNLTEYMHIFNPINQQNHLDKFTKDSSYYTDYSEEVLEFIYSKRSEVSRVIINNFGSIEKIVKSLCKIKKIDFEEDEEWSFERNETEEKFCEKLINKRFDELSEDWEEIVEEDEVLVAANKIAQYFNGEIVKHNISQPKRIKLVPKQKPNPVYSLDECVKDIGLNFNMLQSWLRAIKRKKQIILYGSPGTGKTYVAQKLAQHLIGGGYGFSELVQFHPAYSYEDFIQGIRPQTEDGKLAYNLVPGKFLEFCQKAESYKDICVFIIDEINRANLAQVFGELMYLLEYRDRKISLAGGNTFRIPENVRIIGTMNTADRSIALVDHALRRRFAFIELRTNYEVLQQYHQKNTGLVVDGLIDILKRVNKTIADKNYELGISFFLTPNLKEDIEDIWQMEIEPYLEEYFFDNLPTIDEFRWDNIKNDLLLCTE